MQRTFRLSSSTPHQVVLEKSLIYSILYTYRCFEIALLICWIPTISSSRNLVAYLRFDHTLPSTPYAIGRLRSSSGILCPHVSPIFSLSLGHKSSNPISLPSHSQLTLLSLPPPSM